MGLIMKIVDLHKSIKPQFHKDINAHLWLSINT